MLPEECNIPLPIVRKALCRTRVAQDSKLILLDTATIQLLQDFESFLYRSTSPSLFPLDLTTVTTFVKIACRVNQEYHNSRANCKDDDYQKQISPPVPEFHPIAVVTGTSTASHYHELD